MNTNKGTFVIPDCEITFVDDEGKELSSPPNSTSEIKRNGLNNPEDKLRVKRSLSVGSDGGERGYESSGNHSTRYSDSYNVGPNGVMLDDKRGFLFPSYGALPKSPTSQDERSPLLDSGSGYVSTAPYSSLHSSMETIPRHGLNFRDDGSQNSENHKTKKTSFFKKFKFQLNILKVAVLVGVAIFCVVTLIFIQEKERSFKNIAVKKGEPVYVELSSKLTTSLPVLKIEALGAFLPEKYLNISPYHVWFTVVDVGNNGTIKAVREAWEVPHAPVELSQRFGLIELEHTFVLSKEELSQRNVYMLQVTTDETDHIPITLSVSTFAEILQDGLIMAGVVLLGLYILLVFDLVHRTLASIIAATVAIAFLALTQDRPTLEKVISWLDVETLSLLFGMMILVAILCETGFFDYLAVLAYRLAKGRFWSLLTTLCIFTAFVSAFLDNVTTILLMTPVTIRLCEVMNLDPRKILIALVIFSNIGGASTPVGDPPNVIIISNKDVIEAGIGFAGFTAHCMPGIILCTIGAMIYVRIVYRDVNCFRFKDPPEVEEMKHEIELWKKASNSLSGYSRDENTIKLILKKKVRTMKKTLRKKLYDIKPSEADYKANLEELTSKYKIHNMPLFIKTASVLSIVIIMFFMHSIPDLNLSLGWIALLGAIILLILADFDELESVISRVEWPTLIFFAALFVVMEALSELQLLAYIGNLTETWIMSIPPDSRLWVSILLILWISAIASSFIDNIPFTTIMVQIVVTLGKNDELGLPLIPIIYALAFGACLGGNGTLIGASANVVCAGVAEQHGYRFTFVDFIKMGFPIMILTTIISSGYLIVCHVVLEWNT